MPYHRLWRYQVAPGRITEFEQAYGPTGVWAQLFARGAGYLGTELLRPLPPGTGYITLDHWQSEAAWLAFLEHHASAYQELGRQLDPLCAENVEIGNFQSL